MALRRDNGETQRAQLSRNELFPIDVDRQLRSFESLPCDNFGHNHEKEKMYKGRFKHKPSVRRRPNYALFHRVIAGCVEDTRKEIFQKTCIQDALPEAILTDIALDFELTSYVVALTSFYAKKHNQSIEVQEELMGELEQFSQSSS